MYLLIFKDGTIRKNTTITQEDFEMADNGYLDIIEVSIATQSIGCQNEPKIYHDSFWKKIKNA